VGQQSWGGTLEEVARTLSRKLRRDLGGVGVNVEVRKVISNGKPVKDIYLVHARGLDDDFWSCAFSSPPPPHWLVPTPGTMDGGELQYTPPGEEQRMEYSFHGQTITFSSNSSDGVLNNVGLEPWDAGYVLLALLESLGHSSLGDWKDKSVLEVGSGCGFVGLALKMGLHCRDVLCTDCDDGVLSLLRKNVEPAGVEVRKLDWFEFTDDDVGLGNGFDVIVGSEVIYTPDHAVLSHLISASLRKGGTAIIVNLNRPGWDQFCHNTELDARLDVSVKGVDLEILEAAEGIKGGPTNGGEQYQILTARRK